MPSCELELELPNLRAAVRHLVYTDRLDDAADVAWSLLIYWWLAGFVRRGAAVDAGAARQAAADHRAHARASPLLRAVGRDVAAPVRTRWSRVSASACGCSPRAATRRPRRWRIGRARATARMQFPDLDVAAAVDELSDGARRPCTTRQHVGRGDRRGRARAPLAGRGADRRRAGAFRSRDRDRARRAGPLHARCGGQPASRAELPPRRGRDRRGRVSHELLRLSVAPPLRRGHGIRPRGHVRGRGGRGDAWRAGALAAAAAAIRQRIGVFDVEALLVHTSAARRRCASTIPAGLAAGERAGARPEPRRGGRARAAGRRRHAVREPLATVSAGCRGVAGPGGGRCTVEHDDHDGSRARSARPISGSGCS